MTQFISHSFRSYDDKTQDMKNCFFSHPMN